MSRYSSVRLVDPIPWKTNEVNVLLKGVKANTTMKSLCSTHRRSPESIKAKLNSIATDFYFTNQELFKQIQAITDISEKEFLVHRESITINHELSGSIQSPDYPDISGSPKPSISVNTYTIKEAEAEIQLAVEDVQLGICTSLAVSVLDNIIGGTLILRSTIKSLSTIGA
jgi:hypothetical protein